MQSMRQPRITPSWLPMAPIQSPKTRNSADLFQSNHPKTKLVSRMEVPKVTLASKLPSRGQQPDIQTKILATHDYLQISAMVCQPET